MIHLGRSTDEKRGITAAYMAEHGIEHVVVISGAEPLGIPGSDQVKYSDVIMYVTFYRLLQEITPQTLIVLDECLRTQNRYDLSYNCIRNYLNLTGHQLIFQYLPQIDTREDFMALFDFDTRSRWKRRPFDPELIHQEAQVSTKPVGLRFRAVEVPTSDATRARYQQERERLFRELGNRDPHTLPRNLYLVSTPDKRAFMAGQGRDARYVARNKRLGRDGVVSYGEEVRGERYTVVALPHRFIEFSDFVRRTGQADFPVLIADLKVEQWYLGRYHEWARRMDETANLLN